MIAGIDSSVRMMMKSFCPILLPLVLQRYTLGLFEGGSIQLYYVDIFITATTVTLTSHHLSHCSGSVSFTCEGRNISSGNIFWFVNNSRVAQYGFLGDNFPSDLPITPPLDGVTATVITARAYSTTFDITSVLHVDNVSVLNGASLHCSDSREMSSILFVNASSFIGMLY